MGLLPPDGQTLVQGAVRSQWPIILGPGYREPIKESSLEPLIERGETRILNDLEAYLAARPKSESAFPLFVKGRPIGTFNLASNRANRFSDDDLELLYPVAEQVSVAAANSEAYRQIDARPDADGAGGRAAPRGHEPRPRPRIFPLLSGARGVYFT